MHVDKKPILRGKKGPYSSENRIPWFHICTRCLHRGKMKITAVNIKITAYNTFYDKKTAFEDMFHNFLCTKMLQISTVDNKVNYQFKNNRLDLFRFYPPHPSSSLFIPPFSLLIPPYSFFILFHLLNGFNTFFLLF